MTSSHGKVSYVFKYIFVGDAGVGKSSFLYCHDHGKFNADSYPTIGIEFSSKIIDYHHVGSDQEDDYDTIKVQIWDTAGQEKFQSVTASYYRGACGVFVFYDITNRESFNNVGKWMNRFMDANTEPSVQFTLIGNKCDSNNRHVSLLEGHQLAEKLGIEHFYEVSCRDMINVSQAVSNMTDRVYKIAKTVKHTKEHSLYGIRINKRRYYKGREITNLNRTQIEKLAHQQHQGRKWCSIL